MPCSVPPPPGFRWSLPSIQSEQGSALALSLAESYEDGIQEKLFQDIKVNFLLYHNL